MKKQWKAFLKNNGTLWSYGIVPALVRQLDEAQDETTKQKALDGLATQGVGLDKNDNLVYMMDMVYSFASDNYISLVEYAKLHGKSDASVRQKAQRGGFRTAKKIGRNWVIDKNEPYTDLRKK